MKDIQEFEVTVNTNLDKLKAIGVIRLTYNLEKGTVGITVPNPNYGHKREPDRWGYAYVDTTKTKTYSDTSFEAVLSKIAVKLKDAKAKRAKELAKKAKDARAAAEKALKEAEKNAQALNDMTLE